MGMEFLFLLFSQEKLQRHSRFLFSSFRFNFQVDLGDFQTGRLPRARSAGCRTHLSHAPSRTSRSLQNTTITTTTRNEKKTREIKKNLLLKINRKTKMLYRESILSARHPGASSIFHSYSNRRRLGKKKELLLLVVVLLFSLSL